MFEGFLKPTVGPSRSVSVLCPNVVVVLTLNGMIHVQPRSSKFYSNGIVSLVCIKKYVFGEGGLVVSDCQLAFDFNAFCKVLYGRGSREKNPLKISYAPHLIINGRPLSCFVFTMQPLGRVKRNHLGEFVTRTRGIFGMPPGDVIVIFLDISCFGITPRKCIT